MAFNFLKGFSQDALLQKFKCDFFELKYPKKWKLDTTDNRYSFYYNPNLGDITISIFENQNISREELKQLLLGINENKEPNPDIQLSTSSGQTICLYKYNADNVIWLIKGIIKGDTTYLISLNWNENSWDSFKKILLKSFDSFKTK